MTRKRCQHQSSESSDTELSVASWELTSDGSESDGDCAHCKCGKANTGSMIGCDGSKCRYEWLHFECAGVDPKNVPKGKWFCKDCSDEQIVTDHSIPSGPFIYPTHVGSKSPEPATTVAVDSRPQDVYILPTANGSKASTEAANQDCTPAQASKNSHLQLGDVNASASAMLKNSLKVAQKAIENNLRLACQDVIHERKNISEMAQKYGVGRYVLADLVKEMVKLNLDRACHEVINKKYTIARAAEIYAAVPSMLEERVKEVLHMKMTQRSISNTDENLQRASLEVMSRRMSLEEACKVYKLQPTVLRNKVQARLVLTTDEENELLEMALKMSLRHCIDAVKEAVLSRVKKILDKEMNRGIKRIHSFTNNLPGDSWWDAFLGRHSDLYGALTDSRKTIVASKAGQRAILPPVSARKVDASNLVRVAASPLSIGDKVYYIIPETVSPSSKQFVLMKKPPENESCATASSPAIASRRPVLANSVGSSLSNQPDPAGKLQIDKATGVAKAPSTTVSNAFLDPSVSAGQRSQETCGPISANSTAQLGIVTEAVARRRVGDIVTSGNEVAKVDNVSPRSNSGPPLDKLRQPPRVAEPIPTTEDKSFGAHAGVLASETIQLCASPVTQPEQSAAGLNAAVAGDIRDRSTEPPVAVTNGSGSTPRVVVPTPPMTEQSNLFILGNKLVQVVPSSYTIINSQGIETTRKAMTTGRLDVPPNLAVVVDQPTPPLPGKQGGHQNVTLSRAVGKDGTTHIGPLTAFNPAANQALSGRPRKKNNAFQYKILEPSGARQTFVEAPSSKPILPEIITSEQTVIFPKPVIFPQPVTGLHQKIASKDEPLHRILNFNSKCKLIDWIPDALQCLEKTLTGEEKESFAFRLQIGDCRRDDLKYNAWRALKMLYCHWDLRKVFRRPSSDIAEEPAPTEPSTASKLLQMPLMEPCFQDIPRNKPGNAANLLWELRRGRKRVKMTSALSNREAKKLKLASKTFLEPWTLTVGRANRRKSCTTRRNVNVLETPPVGTNMLSSSGFDASEGDDGGGMSDDMNLPTKELNEEFEPEDLYPGESDREDSDDEVSDDDVSDDKVLDDKALEDEVLDDEVSDDGETDKKFSKKLNKKLDEELEQLNELDEELHELDEDLEEKLNQLDEDLEEELHVLDEDLDEMLHEVDEEFDEEFSKELNSS